MALQPAKISMTVVQDSTILRYLVSYQNNHHWFKTIFSLFTCPFLSEDRLTHSYRFEDRNEECVKKKTFFSEKQLL